MGEFVPLVTQVMESLSTREKGIFFSLRENFYLACVKLIDESKKLLFDTGIKSELKDKTFADKTVMTSTIVVDRETATEKIQTSYGTTRSNNTDR